MLQIKDESYPRYVQISDEESGIDIRCFGGFMQEFRGTDLNSACVQACGRDNLLIRSGYSKSKLLSVSVYDSYILNFAF
jgi:hypothetical protein